MKTIASKKTVFIRYAVAEFVGRRGPQLIETRWTVGDRKARRYLPDGTYTVESKLRFEREAETPTAAFEAWVAQRREHVARCRERLIQAEDDLREAEAASVVDGKLVFTERAAALA